VSDLDIKIAKLLFELETKYPPLQKISFHNAYDVDGVLAIVVGNGDLQRFFSDGGKIPREISDLVRKRIRILEKKGDTRGFLEDLLAPAPITAINTIWLPDGSTETRVIVSGRSRRLPLKVSVLKELAKKIRGITLRVAFER
jgi:transcription antitermination factor NusA-like protein